MTKKHRKKPILIQKPTQENHPCIKSNNESQLITTTDTESITDVLPTSTTTPTDLLLTKTSLTIPHTDQSNQTTESDVITSTFFDNFDMQPSDLPDIYGSVKCVKPCHVNKLRKNNDIRIAFMNNCNEQMDAFSLLIREQNALSNALNQIDIETFVTKQTLEDFIINHQQRIVHFTDDLENVISLARDNRNRFNELKQIDQDIENDENLKKLILGVNTSCDTYKHVMGILNGTKD